MATVEVTQQQPVIIPETGEKRVSEELIEKRSTERNRLLERAQALTINSPESEQLAWELINGIGELKKNIEADFKGSKAAAYAAWKAICAQENGHLEKLAEPDKIIRQKLSDWAIEKRRLAQEEERKQREAAEQERQRLQKEADERQRQEQERLAREAEERKLNEAVAAEAAGKPEIAEAILNSPTVVPVVSAAPMVSVAPTITPNVYAQKVSGAGAMVEVFSFEIVNEAEIPREYLLVDEKAIQKVVEALKFKTNIPGIKVTSKMEPRRAGNKRG